MALSNLYKGLTLVSHITFMHLSCRFHPHIFKVYYSIICSFYGTGIVDTGEEGILIAFFHVVMIPMYIYVFINDFGYYLLQVCIQAVIVEIYYVKVIQKTFFEMPPEKLAHMMAYGCHVTVVIVVVLFGLSHYLMHMTYVRLIHTEKQKNEYETQKVFLLSFSHELRNLINSLSGNVKLASLENIPDRAKELLNNAEVCGELLLHLVNNILDSGKVEIGELEITPAPNKIYDNLERIWSICSELIKRKDLSGTLRIPKNLPRNMMLDHYRFTQILLNLVGNSIKYTDKGSVEVTVEWLPDRFQVEEECFQPYPFNDDDDMDEGIFEKTHLFKIFSDDQMSLSLKSNKVSSPLLEAPMSANPGVLKVIVKDTGCGMPANRLSQLFQKFSQITNDNSKKKLGTGLGLFITKQIVKRMNGEIKVFSREGMGSSFIFCIPVVCGQQEARHLEDIDSLKGLISSKNLKAMIVDDISFNHLILKTFLTKLNIGISDIAVNGLEAYQKYQKLAQQWSRPDIITMDLDMPIMDGKQASRKIRQFEREKGLKPCFLIIVSGNCTNSEVKECLDENGSIKAQAFVKKPVNIEDLIRIIGHSIGKLKDY